ncbi:hypothetical protein D1007_21446 [Hordeum vulgare]|nr:hypothetical protein D1007_21446 [Hordeum vulgare]
MIAPSLFTIAARKNRSVSDALKYGKWLQDLSMGLLEEMLPELLRLATRLDRVQLHEGQPDDISWRFSQDRTYTARSAYRLQFEWSVRLHGHQLIWRGWAPGKCKFLVWTIMLGRLLTADALLRRGWENDYFCPLCVRNLETPSHLFIYCPWSTQIWNTIASLTAMPSLCPASWERDHKFSTWFETCYALTAKKKKKGLFSLVHLITWGIWRERNRRVFNQEYMTADGMQTRFKEEIRLWNLAGEGMPFDPG